MWFTETVQDKLPIKGLQFNFMPSWWYRHYGIEYGERMVFDPDYRVETHQTMRRIMYERFRHIHLGDPDPKPCFVSPDWENAVTSALAGCQVEYPKDNYPIGHHLPEDKLDSLRVPDDLLSVFPYSEFARQIQHLNSRFNTNEKTVFPIRGILNEAVILRGDALFVDMFSEPECARTVLDFSFNLMKRQLEFNGGGCMIFNCTVPMIGPRTYAEKILPLDHAIAEQCRRQGGGFSIHHCGKFDDYAPLYRQLAPAVEALDIGHESDARLAMELFPETAHMSQVVEARLMYRGTQQEVGERIGRLLEATRGHWHRLWLNIADIDYGAPDANLVAVYERLKCAG